MFDIGWQELFIVAVLAIIVVGPKDLPRAIKAITHWVRKARAMARDLQDGLDEVVREAELDDIKKEANKIMNSAGGDPSRVLAEELDLTEFEKDWNETVDDLKAATDPNAKSANAKSSEPIEASPAPEIGALDDDPALAPEPVAEAAAKPVPATEPAPEAATETPPEKAKG